MRILITGSSGQIGTNLGLHLQQNGHDVFGVDKRKNNWSSKIETLQQDLSIPQRDFSTGIGAVDYPADLDVVVHFAAHAKVHELVVNPARALENITMTFNVLEYCRAHNLPIIFSSSREVYGDHHHDTADDKFDIGSAAVKSPYLDQKTSAEAHASFAVAESPYAASKISGEALVHSYSQCYGLPYLIFRFSNVYGRYDNDLNRMERVIPLFIRHISQGNPITIYGEDKMLDFTYVDDCVAGVTAGIERLVSGKIKNHVINLAYGQGNSLVDMTNFIAEDLGIEPNVTIEPSRVGEVTHYIANLGKARALLDYAPQTSLREGIRKTVPWSTAWWDEHGIQ